MPFDLAMWLASVHPQLSLFESTLRANAFEEEETITMLDVV